MYIHAVQIDINIHSCYLSLSLPIPCSAVICQPVHHRPRASSLPPPCLPLSARQPDCRHCAITPSSSTYLAVDATTSLLVSTLIYMYCTCTVHSVSTSDLHVHVWMKYCTDYTEIHVHTQLALRKQKEKRKSNPSNHSPNKKHTYYYRCFNER